MHPIQDHIFADPALHSAYAYVKSLAVTLISMSNA